MSSSKRTHLPSAGPSSRPLPFARYEADSDKDDEELELEETLFGKKRKRVGAVGDKGSKKGKEKGKGRGEMPGVEWSVDAAEGEDEEMGDFADDQLFSLDLPTRNGAASMSDEEDSEVDYEAEQNSAGDSSGSEEDDNQSLSSSSSATSIKSSPSTSWLPSKPSKAPLWTDPSDSKLSINLSSHSRLRKLVRGQDPAETMVNGAGLEKKLREQFGGMYGEVEWAKKDVRAKDTKGKGKKTPAQVGHESLAQLLSNTAPLLSSTSKNGAASGPLPKGTISIKRLRDANHQSRIVWEGGNGKKKPVNGKKVEEKEGKKEKYEDTGLLGMKFHPNVNVLAMVGGDRRLKIYSIDGHTNPSLLSIHIPSLPIKSLQFHPSGSSLLLTGPRPFYYTYDLQSQRCLRSPQNLLSSLTGSASSSQSLEKTAFSPDGSVLAIAGKRGSITLMAWGPGGSGQVLTTLYSGRTGAVHDLLWRSEKELWVLGEGSEVDVWDLGERRCVGRWRDYGGFGGRLLGGSGRGEYCAVGSTTGVVNIYDANSITQGLGEGSSGANEMLSDYAPKPVREMMNLTTAVTSVSFNHDAQIMAIASSKKKDAFRMIHLPSATTFSNWPTSSTPLGVVTCADFSPRSEYVAIGNTRGKAVLYGLEHYGA